MLPNQLCGFDWQNDQRPRHGNELVIYELHVRGFTRNPNSGVPEPHRGTFLGVVDKIPYLVELGITAVELMPIFQFDPDDGNYWGYMPLNFYSPHHAYAAKADACSQQLELRTMVEALHQAGIEVILDVVYNHMIPNLMTRLYGSCDLFPDDRLHAFQPPLSVNYITSHDGSTLYDLVSYNQKRNWANGHDNTDGSKEYSWNSGWEGDDGVPHEVQQLRKQQVKNFICLLLLSNGTPMFRMGDEFMQTQYGNNNPYNQDNETSWLDWDRLSEHDDIFRFFKQMIAFRKAHPSISRSRFWRDDITWYGTGHLVDMSPASQQLAYCLHGASQNDTDLYVMINAGTKPTEFGIQEGAAGSWHRVVDTSLPSPNDFSKSQAEVVNQTSYAVGGRSVVVVTN